MSPELAAALRYADRGWQVMPLHTIVNGRCTCGTACKSPGKHPRTARGLYDATDDPDQIERWWAQYPNANIGIRTGKASGLWVVDIDNKKSVEIGDILVGAGENSLRQLEQDAGSLLPPTLTSLTGSGGMHLVFDYPQDTEEGMGNRANIAPGIDIRGDGGYIVVPPSLHASGKRYEWVEEDHPTSSPPRWLTRLTIDREHEPFEELDAVGEGGRNDYLHRYASKLRGEGRSQEDIRLLTLAMNQTACTPPLELDEVYRIINNVMAYPEPVKTPDFIFPEEDESIPELTDLDDIFISYHKYLEEWPDPPAALVGGGMLDAGDGAILAGPSGTGKSWAAMDMALSVANGIPWLGEFTTERAPVLYIDEEGSGRRGRERIESLTRGRPEIGDYTKGLDNIKFAHMNGLKIDTDRGLTIIRRAVEKWRPGLLIFDTMVRSHTGIENSNEDMARFFDVVNKLRSVYTMAFLFIHHTRKPTKDDPGDLGDMLRGAGDIRAWPDSILVALKEPGVGMKMHHVKSRNHKEHEPFLVGMDISTEEFHARIQYVGGATQKPHTTEDVRAAIMQVIVDHQRQSSVTPELIAGVLSLTPKTVKEHLTPLEAMGAVRKYTTGRVTNYVVPAPEVKGDLV